MKGNGSRLVFRFQAVFIISSCLFSSSLRANERVAELAEKYTVRLEGATQGSGVLVEQDGKTFTVLTSWHVVKDQNIGEELDIYTLDGTRHSADTKSIRRIGNVDMAIVKFNSDLEYSTSNINPSSRVRAGSRVYVTGYPLPTTAVPSRILRFTSGSVIANAKIFVPKGYQILYSNITYPGMSGGSVINDDGNLVGIHGQGEIDSMETQKRGIAIKTGTNQAVPIRYYLEHKGVLENSPYQMRSANQSSITFDNLIVEAKSLIGKYQDGLSALEGNYELSEKFVVNNQQYLDNAISRIEKVLAISRTPEALLIAGTAYNYKKAAHFHINWYPTASQAAVGSKERQDYYRVERYLKNKVLSNLDEAIYLDPANIDALKYRGSLKEDDDLGTGIGDFNKIIEIDPRNLEGLSRRAASYYGLGIGAGLRQSSLSQKNAYLRLSIEDYTRAMRLDPTDNSFQGERANARYRLYKNNKYSFNPELESLLKDSCIDAYEAQEKGFITLFPNLPIYKEFRSDCNRLTNGDITKRYNREDESSIPSSFKVHPKYVFYNRQSCKSHWSKRQCDFFAQLMDSVSYMKSFRCWIIDGTATSTDSIHEFWLNTFAPENYFSKEVAELIVEMGGVEQKAVIQVVDSNYDSVCGG